MIFEELVQYILYCLSFKKHTKKISLHYSQSVIFFKIRFFKI